MKGMTKALTLAINKLWVRLEPLPAAGGRPRALNFSEGRKTKPQRPTEKQKDRNKKTEVLWLQGRWRSIGSSPGLWRVALLSRVPPSSCCPPAHELCLGTTLLTAWALCSTVLNVLQGFLWRRKASRPLWLHRAGGWRNYLAQTWCVSPGTNAEADTLLWPSVSLPLQDAEFCFRQKLLFLSFLPFSWAHPSLVYFHSMHIKNTGYQLGIRVSTTSIKIPEDKSYLSRLWFRVWRGLKTSRPLPGPDNSFYTTQWRAVRTWSMPRRGCMPA